MASKCTGGKIAINMSAQHSHVRASLILPLREVSWQAPVHCVIADCSNHQSMIYIADVLNARGQRAAPTSHVQRSHLGSSAVPRRFLKPHQTPLATKMC